jgi:lysophospholipase L1-like esterase
VSPFQSTSMVKASDQENSFATSRVLRGRFRGVALAVLALLALRAPALGATRPDVWLLGDSVTAIYGYWVAVQNPPWAVWNFGRGSETSGQGFQRAVAMLQERAAPDVVVLQWGTNDAVAGVSAEDYAVNVAATARLFREHGTFVIVTRPLGFVPLSSVPKETSGLDLLRHLHAETVRQRRALTVVLRSAGGFPTIRLKTRPRDYWQDAFHPSVEAYRDVLAPRLMQDVRRLGDLP